MTQFTQTARGQDRPETVTAGAYALVALLARIAARSRFSPPLADPAPPVRRDPALSIPQEVPCETT
jgi:hypothetical protein